MGPVSPSEVREGVTEEEGQAAVPRVTELG